MSRLRRIRDGSKIVSNNAGSARADRMPAWRDSQTLQPQRAPHLEMTVELSLSIDHFHRASIARPGKSDVIRRRIATL